MAALADLKNQVLYTTNKLHSGQTATAEVGDKAGRAIAAEIAVLAKRGVIDYVDVTDMPEEDEAAIVLRSAWRSRFELTLSPERAAFLREAQAEALREIYANHEQPYDGEPVEATYY